MKKTILISIISLFIFSCEDDENTGANDQGDSDLKLNTAYYNIDGTTYDVSEINWDEFTSGSYTITGTGDNSASLTMYFPSIQVGEYTFNDPKTGGDDIGVDIATTSSVFSAVHTEGIINITESTQTFIKGEFSGDFTNKTTTLNGSGEFYIEIK
ncbi:MAG: hypothetical protein ABJF11_13570 [Reichenbachiella sp.]|uniref:hypothetical protein n=1 Tax=Reichenbachiella sp. TaxID=2184521 RepID=UPI003263F32B